MMPAFYIAGAVAIIATAMVILGRNPVHSLLYLIVSLLSVAIVFFTLGAPFVGVLEIIVYAGAIMVLFIFVVMMLNLGPVTVEQESRWLRATRRAGPVGLALLLAAAIGYIIWNAHFVPMGQRTVPPKEVSLALFGPYALVVELASVLLLAGLIGAFHLVRRPSSRKEAADGSAH